MLRIQWVRLALVALVVAVPATAFAQPTKAGVVTTVLGTATVSRASLSQPVPLKFKDDVFAQDRVSTGDDSVARILLGGRAIVTVRERSSLTITEVPHVSTIDVGVGGAPALEQLQDDEARPASRGERVARHPVSDAGVERRHEWGPDRSVIV